MQATFNRKALLSVMQAIGGIVDHALDPPILQLALINVHLGGDVAFAQCSGTDLRRVYTADLEVESSEPGAVGVDPEPMIKLLKAMGREQVTLHAQPSPAGGLMLEVTAGGSMHRLNALPGADYPRLYLPPPDATWNTYPGLILAEIIDHAGISMDPSDKRPHLNGLLFDRTDQRLIAVSCDGHRLTKAESSQSWPFPRLFIPKRGIVEIRRFLDPMGQIQLHRSSDWLFLRYGTAGRMLGVRLQDSEQFPRWEVLLQPGPIHVQMGRDALLGACKRLMATMDDGGGIKFSLRAGACLAQGEATAAGQGQEELPCVYAGRDRALALSGKLLVELLETFACESIVMELQEAEGEPIMVRPDTAQAFYCGLIMCMRA